MPLTQEDRLKGSKIGVAQRQIQMQQRREKVKKMYDTGMSKAAIARELGVHYQTVINDLKDDK